jgi:hypothetical protein
MVGTIIRAYLIASGHKSIEDQIRDCAKRYTVQTGQSPNLCHVHPELISQPTTIDDIKVMPATGLLRFDIWLSWVDPNPISQPQLF